MFNMLNKERQDKFVVMCVGYTHSGKTTFAKKLVKDVGEIVLLDNDEIATFINEKYPLAVFSDYNKVKRTYKEPNLKFLLFQEVFKFCLRAGVNVIHSSGNLGKDSRQFIKINTKKYNYKLVTVYFNLPKELISERIKNTKKDTKAFKSSKSWSEILPRQELYAELPPSKMDTIYFEIQNEADYKSVLNELKNLLLK